MTTTKTTCESCKYWGRNSHQVWDDKRQCDYIGLMIGEPGKDTSFNAYGEVEVHTEKDFGCVAWEPND